MTEQEAATYRQLVREHRALAAAEEKYFADTAPDWSRRYRIEDNSYECLLCGHRPERPFVDPAQASDNAVAHVQTCEEARRA